MRVLAKLLVVAVLMAGMGSCVPLRPRRTPPPPPLPPRIEMEPVGKPGPPPHAPAHGVRRKTAFHYYPAREVYFDPVPKVYFWLEGGTWRTGVILPDPLRLALGDFVRVELDGDNPEPFHASIKGKYPPGQVKKATGQKKPPKPATPESEKKQDQGKKKGKK